MRKWIANFEEIEIGKKFKFHGSWEKGEMNTKDLPSQKIQLAKNLGVVGVYKTGEDFSMSVEPYA